MSDRFSGTFVTLALTATLLVQPAAAAVPSVTPDIWTAYFSSQGKNAAWADTVRGKNHGTMDLADGGDSEGDPGASVEPPRVGTTQDLIVPLGWGIRSGKDEQQVSELIADIKAHGVTARKKALAEQVMQLERKYRNGRIYWQIGNEINARNLGRSLGKADGLGSASGFDDPAIIPLYAEYIFAPTVEVLQEVSQKLYGDKKRIKVVLGTIANARRASSREWLDRLLTYGIKGTYAPSLTNSRIADNISVIALHYVVTADDPAWESIFDGLSRKWLKTGNVEAIWGTEEIGGKLARSGAGAATSVRVAMSYLSRAAQLQLSSTALRCSFFGWRWGPAGSTADAGMRILLASFGHARLADLSGKLRLGAKGRLQGYAFSPVDNGKRRLTAVFSRGSGAAELSEITLPQMKTDTATQATAMLFSPGGTRVVDFTVTTAGGETHYRSPSPVHLGSGETLVLREGV